MVRVERRETALSEWVAFTTGKFEENLKGKCYEVFFKSVTRPGNKMPIALIIVITQLTFYIIKLSALWII